MTAIHIKSPALSLRAGKRALTRIREQGLQPADVAILPGAAGGPKGLGIQGLDLALFGDWLPRAPRERTLIGASIGSWRFASACLPDPCAGIRRLGELYTSQRFAKGVSMAEVSRSCVQLLDDLLAPEQLVAGLVRRWCRARCGWLAHLGHSLVEPEGRDDGPGP